MEVLTRLIIARSSLLLLRFHFLLLPIGQPLLDRCQTRLEGVGPLIARVRPGPGPGLSVGADPYVDLRVRDAVFGGAVLIWIGGFVTKIRIVPRANYMSQYFI